MSRKEKEFYLGQRVVIMDMKSGTKKETVVFSVDSLNLVDPKIIVRNSGGEVSFDKETLRGETVYGSCVLMHVKA